MARRKAVAAWQSSDGERLATPAYLMAILRYGP